MKSLFQSLCFLVLLLVSASSPLGAASMVFSLQLPNTQNFKGKLDETTTSSVGVSTQVQAEYTASGTAEGYLLFFELESGIGFGLEQIKTPTQMDAYTKLSSSSSSFTSTTSGIVTGFELESQFYDFFWAFPGKSLNWRLGLGLGEVALTCGSCSDYSKAQALQAFADLGWKVSEGMRLELGYHQTQVEDIKDGNGDLVMSFEQHPSLISFGLGLEF